jgi:iron(III) transport system permease protein
MFVYLRVTRHAHKYQTVTGKGYRPKRISLRSWKYPALTFVIGYLFVSTAAPLLFLVWVSLLPFYQQPSLEALKSVSLSPYAEVLRNPRVGLAATNTVVVMVAAATITMLLSLLIAWVSLRSRVRGARLLEGLAFASLAVRPS